MLRELVLCCLGLLGPSAAQASLRFTLAPEAGLTYSFRETARITLSSDGRTAEPLQFANNGSLDLRAQPGGDGSVLTLTLLAPQIDETTLVLDDAGNATTFASGDELLPGVSSAALQAEPRYSADWLARRTPLLLSGAPEELKTGAHWTQIAEAKRPGGDVLLIEMRLTVANVDRDKNVVQLEVLATESLLNPAAEPWGPLKWTTLNFSSELRGSATWDMQRGHLAQASLSGPVRETRALPDGRTVQIEEQVELVIGRVQYSVPKEGGATTQPSDAGRVTSADPAKRDDAGGGQSPPYQEPVTPTRIAEAAPVGADGSPVLAKLGDVEITESQIARHLLEGLKGKAWPQGERLETLKRALLSQRIVQHVFEAWGAKHPELVPPAVIDAAIAKQEEQYAARGGDFDTALLAVGMTREDVRAQMLAELARQKLDERSKDRARAQAFYDPHKDAFDGTRVLVEHLAIRVDPLLAGESEHKAVRDRLLKVRDEIVAGKMTFADAVAKYDQKPRPDLPPLTRYGVIDDPVAAAAFALAPGEVSEPIRSQTGWHLIKVNAREPGTPQTFEDAWPAIREHLRVADFEAMLQEVLREKGLKVYGG